jgi:putative redox protein
MIRATAEDERYLNKFTNGNATGFADVPIAQEGTGVGFRPHELLEAALATCINITLRVYAEKHNVPLEDASVRVTLDHSSIHESVFRYQIELVGADLTSEHRTKLMGIANACSVHRTLSRTIRFECDDSGSSVTPAAKTTALGT